MPGYSRDLFVLEAVESVSHGDTQTGVDNATNVRLFMRHGLIVDGIPLRVPDLSENALRSVLFRRPLGDHLLASLGIGAGELPQSVMNLLYAGGNLTSGSSAPGNEHDLATNIRKLYPSLWLLGGATDSFVLPKSALSLACWPLTLEYAPLVERISPEHAEDARKVSVFDLLFEETRTRGTGSESSGNQMLYSYETIAAGTRFLIETTLSAWTTPAVRSAVAVALSEWDGYFGGQARQGRGRMTIVGKRPGNLTSYLEHLAEHGEEMKAGLLDGTLGTGKPLCASQ
jgi:hypothetical protein